MLDTLEEDFDFAINAMIEAAIYSFNRGVSPLHNPSVDNWRRFANKTIREYVRVAGEYLGDESKEMRERLQVTVDRCNEMHLEWQKQQEMS